MYAANGNVTVTSEDVLRLRDETGAPLLRCKFALIKCNGDRSAAKRYPWKQLHNIYPGGRW